MVEWHSPERKEAIAFYPEDYEGFVIREIFDVEEDEDYLCCPGM